MIGIALALAAGPAASQLLAGPAFERFAAAADRRCPAARLRSITPGDLDYLREGFLDTLTPVRRARIAAVNAADARCSGHNGLACPATATLTAFTRTRVLSTFVAFACGARPPR